LLVTKSENLMASWPPDVFLTTDPSVPSENVGTVFITFQL